MTIANALVLLHSLYAHKSVLIFSHPSTDVHHFDYPYRFKDPMQSR